MLLKLVGAPIAVPLGGFKFILETLRDMAERELYDVDRLREELLLLQLQLQDGEISEEDYLDREADVIGRLRVARQYWQDRAEAHGNADDDGVIVATNVDAVGADVFLGEDTDDGDRN